MRSTETVIRELLITKVKAFNHGRSLVVTREQARRLARSINYTIAHDLRHDPDPQRAYRNGLAVIEARYQEVFTRSEQLRQQALPFFNQRYQEVLQHQLLSALLTYEPELSAHILKADLDYPLIDGLAMDTLFKTYQGIDRLDEYTRRLATEHRYLHSFPLPDLQQLLTAYQKQHQVDVYPLDLNLAALCLDQQLANLLINKPGIACFTAVDSETIMRVLKQITDPAVITDQLFRQLETLVDPQIYAYLKLYRPVFQVRFKTALITGNYATLFYRKVAITAPPLLIQPAGLNKADFNALCNQLNRCTDERQLWRILHTHPLNEDDFIDLLQATFLTVEQLIFILQELDPYPLARLFRRIAGSELAFSDIKDRDRAFYARIPADEALTQALIACVTAYDDNDLKAFNSCLASLIF